MRYPRKEPKNRKDAMASSYRLTIATLFFEFVPFVGIGLFDFERPQVRGQLDAVLALELLRYSPRVRASTASAILELAGGKYGAGLIQDLHRRCRGPVPVASSTDLIFHARGIFAGSIERNHLS